MPHLVVALRSFLLRYTYPWIIILPYRPTDRKTDDNVEDDSQLMLLIFSSIPYSLLGLLNFCNFYFLFWYFVSLLSHQHKLKAKFNLFSRQCPLRAFRLFVLCQHCYEHCKKYFLFCLGQITRNCRIFQLQTFHFPKFSWDLYESYSHAYCYLNLLNFSKTLSLFFSTV